jgi:5-methylcytosine-specific restriction protein A
LLHKFYKYIVFGNRSLLWGETRKKHIEKQPFCQACGSTKNLQVHHIEPFHVNPSRELDPTNLITLCGKNCHLVFGHLMDYTSWNTEFVKDAQYYFNKVRNRPYKSKKQEIGFVSKLFSLLLFNR